MKSENSKEEMCQNTDNEKLRRSINRNTDRLDSLAKEVKELKEAQAETASPMPVAIYDTKPAPQPFPNDYATTTDLNKVASVMSRMDTSIRTLTGKIPYAQKPPSLSKDEIREEVKARTVEAVRGKEIIFDLKFDERKYAESIAKVISEKVNKQIEEHMEEAMTKGVKTAIDSKVGQLNYTGQRLADNLRHLLHGSIWFSIPKWVKVTFFSVLALAICFGTGFFLVLKQNSKLRDAEWLYRYKRAGWLTTEENRQTLIDRERKFLHGTPVERDSIQDLIRRMENRYDSPSSELYFNPVTD